MCTFKYQLVEWPGPANPYKPDKFIHMTVQEAYKLNNLLIMNGETIRWVQV